jgi:aminopeptidase
LADPRVVEHAKIVVNYCCRVKKGDGVVVLASAEAKPLIKQIAEEVGRAGGHLLVVLADASIDRAHLLAASDDVVETTPKTFQKLLEGTDVLIQIFSDLNTKEMSDVPPNKLMLQQRAWAPLFPVIGKLRWNITLHPTAALAQQAGKSLEAFSNFVYGATLVDWPAMKEKMQVLADRMAKTSVVRIVGVETDITLSIAGRKPRIDDGDHNLPGGEVFTSPVEDSANGAVYFDKPIMYAGSEIRGVRLVFKDGSIISQSAESGEELLGALLNTDPGAKKLGELGIGMNRGITDFSKNTLFDEKMGDSIHMAVGLGFPEVGGENQSGIHVDMIKGMKEGGTIYFDGEPIYAAGKFVWE